MAAGGGPPVPSGPGGKKSVDFQLNLIPFIDLLSVLISFLLMTSVWTQVGRIGVEQAPTQPGEAQSPPDDPALGLTVLIKGSGYTVSKRGGVIRDIDKRGAAYDVSTLSEILKVLAAEHPENRKVTITSEDAVPYQELIRVMDVCLERGLEGISVAGVDA